MKGVFEVQGSDLFFVCNMQEAQGKARLSIIFLNCTFMVFKVQGSDLHVLQCNM